MVQSTEQLSSDTEINYERFIDDILNTGCVWGLEGPDGWAICPSEEHASIDVMPLWSQPEFAQCHCIDEWKIYQPVAIALEEFLDEWLLGMHKDEILVGVNWDKSMDGAEVEPLDLLEDIEAS